ncbi:MAG: flagellar motor switch protein FliN [Planctomycetota bacterium]|jgi:flagellar motor switch protein FliN/FliY
MGKKKKEEQKKSDQTAVIDEKEDQKISDQDVGEGTENQEVSDQAVSDEQESQEMPDQAVSDEEAIKSIEFSPLNPLQTKPGEAYGNIDMLMDVQIPLLVELGKTEMMMRDILALSPGAIIELDSMAGEPVKITIRGKIIAQGEVVVVDENFGVKITKIANPQERIKSAG